MQCACCLVQASTVILWEPRYSGKDNDALLILKFLHLGYMFFSFLLSFRLFCMFFLPHILWKRGMRGIKKREREGNPVFHKCPAHAFQQAENHLVSCCCFLVICIDSMSWHLLAPALPSIFCECFCLNVSSCIFLEIQEPSSSAAVILYLALASSNKKTP